MSDDYEVGYKKPPKHTQFQPGQSGNRKGRPKKVRRPPEMEVVRREFIKAMEQEICTKTNGKERKVPAIIALYDQLLAKALKGHFPTSKLLFETYCKFVNDDEDQRMSLFELVLEIQKGEEERIQAAFESMTPEEQERKIAAETAMISRRAANQS